MYDNLTFQCGSYFSAIPTSPCHLKEGVCICLTLEHFTIYSWENRSSFGVGDAFILKYQLSFYEFFDVFCGSLFSALLKAKTSLYPVPSRNAREAFSLMEIHSTGTPGIKYQACHTFSVTLPCPSGYLSEQLLPHPSNDKR